MAASARQFPTAAAEFWFRLQHVTHLQQSGDTELSKEDADKHLPGQQQALRRPAQVGSANSVHELGDEVMQLLPKLQPSAFCMPGKVAGAIDTHDATHSSSSDGEQDQGVQWGQHGSPLNEQVIFKEEAADTAGSRQQRSHRDEPVQKPTRASWPGFAAESKLQHLADCTSLEDGAAGQSPNSHVQSHQQVQHSFAAVVESDSDTDDDDPMVDHRNITDSKRRCTSQLLGKETVTQFMARLHKPGSPLLQHQHLPQGLSQQDKRPMQQQESQQVLRQYRPAVLAQRTGLAPVCNLLENRAEDTASTSSQYSDDVPTTLGPEAQYTALKQPHLTLHLTSKENCSHEPGMGMSPVQMAVSAVVGRLQSVQQGLASAEDRLALLTAKLPANDRQVHVPIARQICLLYQIIRLQCKERLPGMKGYTSACQMVTYVTRWGYVYFLLGLLQMSASASCLCGSSLPMCGKLPLQYPLAVGRLCSLSPPQLSFA